MLEKPYLSPQLIDFIQKNLHRDLAELALEAKKYPEMPMPFVIEQIYGKRKAKLKLPSWHENEQLIYPSKVSMEQCSSEQTASFKASLIQGDSLIDLTGGLGIDVIYFSKSFREVSYVEQQEDLVTIVKHNAQVLGITNLVCHQGNGVEFIEKNSKVFDWIYLDPARRDSQNNKLVGLESCQPNVLLIKEELLQKSKNILLKLSPMLDIHLAIRQLACVQKVWVVSVQNECKELLFQLGNEVVDDIPIHCVDIQKDNTVVQFEALANQEYYAQVELSDPKTYLYEPNVAILKGGLYKTLANQFNFTKLHAHSHLYTADELIEYFPGRSFKTLAVYPFNKKVLLKAIPTKKINITVRNFPLTVAEIRKKTGLKDGGDLYLFATTNKEGKKLCVLCEKA